MLSVFPLEMHDTLKSNFLSRLLDWWRGYFQVVPFIGKGEEGDMMKALNQASRYHTGTPFQAVLLFVALMRALGVRARLVASLSPRPLAAQVNQKEEGFGEWAEVLINKRWISVHVLEARIKDPPHLLESSLKKFAFSYIIALERAGRWVKDVTLKYCHRWTGHVQGSLRLRDEALQWWLGLLSPSSASEGKKEVEGEEEEEVERNQVIKASKTLPTSFQDYKHHPLYVLERHLSQAQVLYPKHPTVGYVRGEPVYLRSCLNELKSKEMWYKQGRVIKPGEEPARLVKQKLGTIQNKRIYLAEIMEGNPVPLTGLFGLWQTEPYQPPPVINGKIPKNKFGNVELFTKEMLPPGAVYFPHATNDDAKALGVDYADVVVGFTFNAQRCFPEIKGIVIAAENAHLLQQRIKDKELERVQSMEQERVKEALKRWRKLLLIMEVKRKIKHDYQISP